MPRYSALHPETEIQAFIKTARFFQRPLIPHSRLLLGCTALSHTVVQQTYAVNWMAVVLFAPQDSLGCRFCQARSQKLRKATMSFVCLSVHPHGTTRLPLDGFPWNLMFYYFRKFVKKIQVSLKSDKNNGYFTWRPTYFYDRIWLKIILRIRNVSDKCRENQNTHFMFNNFFPKILLFLR